MPEVKLRNAFRESCVRYHSARRADRKRVLNFKKQSSLINIYNYNLIIYSIDGHKFYMNLV